MATIAWYLGAVGSLVEIPPPDGPSEVGHNLRGGVHESLTGATTVDRVATPRTWPLQWKNLTEDQVTYLELVGHGLAKGPLRLVDPMRRNRLSKQIATGGSLKRAVTEFSQSGGSTPTWVALTAPPATVRVRGCVSWERTTTAAGILTASGTSDRVPLITSQQVRVSCWARGAAIQAAVGLDAYDAAGSASRTTGTATTLHATTWTQLTVTSTPASDRVSLAPLLSVASGQSAATLQVTGWMVSDAAASTTWALGGGAPTVVASELGQSYSLFDEPRLTWQMTLRESVI